MAIAGYTNAGKSSLLNRLTGAQVLVDDSLFATLDPAVRKARTPCGWPYTLTDTVVAAYRDLGVLAGEAPGEGAHGFDVGAIAFKDAIGNMD